MARDAVELDLDGPARQTLAVVLGAPVQLAVGVRVCHATATIDEFRAHQADAVAGGAHDSTSTASGRDSRAAMTLSNSAAVSESRCSTVRPTMCAMPGICSCSGI